nr:lysozyme inhibitor LprI family protein [Fortiea contorta]
MHQLLSTFITVLTLGSLSTATVTIASTPVEISNIYLTQKLNCNNAQTQSQINQCAQLAYQAADKKLNQSYQQLLPKLSASRKQKLITAQQAWLKFRDTSCDFERSGYEGGTIAPAIYFGCLESTTNQRTKQLQEYLQPTR